MSQDHFKVIYTGEIKEGFEIESVAKMFSSKFKMTPEKALKLLQAGREITLNKNSEHLKAYKLKSAFEEIGMQVRLERILLLVSNEELEEQQKDSKDNQEKSENLEKSENQEKADVSKVDDKANVHEKLNKASESWTLDPLKKEEEDSQEPNDEQDGTVSKSDFNYTGLSNSPVIDTKKIQNDSEESSSDEKNNDKSKGSDSESNSTNPIISFLKRFGGVIAGALIAIVVILKKFGLLKILKIGVLAAAATFAGFESEVLCMGNDRCEEIIDEQLEICWDDKGFDDYDWEGMSDEEYFALKPNLETEVLACFIDTETAQNVFVSPIEVRMSLIYMCDESAISNCEEIVEPQIRSCYDKHKLGSYVNANTLDYYAVVAEFPDTFESFYGCFVDEKGVKIVETDFSGLK